MAYMVLNLEDENIHSMNTFQPLEIPLAFLRYGTAEKAEVGIAGGATVQPVQAVSRTHGKLLNFEIVESPWIFPLRHKLWHVSYTNMEHGGYRWLYEKYSVRNLVYVEFPHSIADILGFIASPHHFI